MPGSSSSKGQLQSGRHESRLPLFGSITDFATKILSPIGRHAQVVASAPIFFGVSSRTLLIIIGVVETAIALWVVSGIRPRWCAIVQTGLLAGMTPAGLFGLATQTPIDRSPLAPVILAGLAFFWLMRLVFPWFVYDRSLWRGHTFNTFVHFAFTGVWVFLTGVYGWGFWHQIE